MRHLGGTLGILGSAAPDMSRISGCKRGLIVAPGRACTAYSGAVNIPLLRLAHPADSACRSDPLRLRAALVRRAMAPWWLALVPLCAAAQNALQPGVQAPAAAVVLPAAIPAAAVASATALASEAATALAPAGARVLAQAGALDARLTLAPCASVQAYLPAGVPPWGRTRVGLRCTAGTVRWNVFLPVTVAVWGPGLVSSVALPAGARLADSQLVRADVDLAADPSATFQDADLLAGRVLARPLAAGQAVRAADLVARKWFASGDAVQIDAAGSGFSVSARGQAMSPGIEGMTARIKLDNGRQLTARVVGERRVEVDL